MAARAIYTDQDGRMIILIPADIGLTIEQIASKDVPPGTTYFIVDSSILPQNKRFRNAWFMDGINISINMSKARDMTRAILRSMGKQVDENSIRAASTPDELETIISGS